MISQRFLTKNGFLGLAARGVGSDIITMMRRRGG
jgi:hypothetical protein